MFVIRGIMIVFLSLFFTLESLEAQDRIKDKRPNIIVILSDDIGFEEFGIYKVTKGEKSNTPNIDKLGAQGVAFKTAYAQSICGPSRAMFYSGNYAMNNGAYDNKIEYRPEDRGKSKNLEKFPNFVRVLHDAGYKTAVAGKWHNPIGGMLGVNNDILGVDQYVVYNSNQSSVNKITGQTLTPDENWENAAISGEPILSRYWKPTYVQDGKLLKTSMKDYGPDLLKNYICDFIKDNANSEQPFLAFYPMVLAHSSHCVTPIEVAKGEKASNVHYRWGSEKGASIFKNQVKYADKLVGDIVKTIKDQGIEENTIIIFTSDNGTTSSAKSKGVEYGVHIPFIVAGHGIKKRGMTDELIDFTDVLPTLADFANATIPSKYKIDGSSTKDFLTGKNNHTKDVIYAQPGIASIVRTKEYLLEAVCPLYGFPNGRFYQTNESFDGRGYKNITHDENFKKQRADFQKLLDKTGSKLPTSFDDTLWKNELKRGFKHFTSPQQRRAHLRLPLKYQFYDPSF
jgi:arylsulfatase A